MIIVSGTVRSGAGKLAGLKDALAKNVEAARAGCGPGIAVAFNLDIAER